MKSMINNVVPMEVDDDSLNQRIIEMITQFERIDISIDSLSSYESFEENLFKECAIIESTNY